MELPPQRRHLLNLAGVEGRCWRGHRQEHRPVTYFHASFGTRPPLDFA